MASASIRRGDVLAVAGIAAVGLALRVAYILAVDPRPAGLGDAREFDGLANVLADGRGFVNPFAFGKYAAATAHKPPLYPLVLAAVSELGGDSFRAHQLASAVIGATTVVVIALLTHRIAGRRASLVAAGLAAVFPVFVARDGSLHSETLYALLVAAALVAAWATYERPSRGAPVALGAIIGLAALTRSEGVLLLVVLAAPVLWRSPHGRRGGRAALVVLACGVILAPWLIRCWVVFDRPVAITTSTGDLLAGANCHTTYRGPLIGEWAFNCVVGARGKDEAAVADRLRSRGLRYAEHHAGGLPAVVGARALRPWGLFRPDQEIRLQATAGGGPRAVGWIGLATFWGLFLLAVGGAVTLRRRGRPLVVLLAPLALVVVVSVTSYGILRFRAAGDVAVVMLAAVALAALADRGASPHRSAPAQPEVVAR